MRKSNKEWEVLGKKIIKAAKTELYLSMRYLYNALDALEPNPDLNIKFLATDGNDIFFMPMMLAEKYMESPVALNRAYLHSVLHCLFGHFYKRGNREEELWNLSCDIMVEGIIDSLHLSSVQYVIPPIKEEAEERISKNVKIFSAEYIYDYLRTEKEDILSLFQYFTVDDHVFWDRKEDRNEDKNNEKKEERDRDLWKEIGSKLQTELETYARTIGTEKSKLYQSIVFENREKVSYESFLRRFKEPVEETKLDMESFDYGFYNYGLSIYGNMPLIEEPEYKLSNKIRSFAVVIDTSGSISRELVADFLWETVSIITENNGAKIGEDLNECIIIQCDNEIQDVAVLRSKEELFSYVEGFEITGRGGTDFRPAFSYVDKEIEEKRIEKLSGMIYFTDGYGIYPEYMPDYGVSFVFPETSYYDGKMPYESDVFPKWAMHIVLEGKKERKG